MAHAATHAMLHQCFNDRDFATIEEHTAPGFMFEDLARALTVKSAPDFTDYLKEWVAALSDANVGSATYLEGPDFSVATFHGRGHFDGRVGDTPGNGALMDLPMSEVLHYAADGKVLSGELYYDQMTQAAQLGLMPAADAALDATETPSSVVRAMMRDFDSLDIAALEARFTDEVRGIDEISRAWIRDRDGMHAYFAGLEGAVSDVATTMFDLDEQVWGDTALVTGWMEQDYRMQGEPVHISSPFTIALRRDGTSWKVALVHVVPMPPEA